MIVEWVKLRCDYYRDPKVMALDPESELLFVRSLAYAGDQETGGFIPESVLPALCPVRRYARAVSALVAQGLWAEMPTGWRIVRWDDHQAELEILAARRAADRERKRRERARSNSAGHTVVT